MNNVLYNIPIMLYITINIISKYVINNTIINKKCVITNQLKWKLKRGKKWPKNK